MTALYTSGTISLVNGSAVITGIDTAWKTALIVGGTVHVEAEGNPLPILPDDSAGASEHPITDTEMTAAIKWQGATGTYKYALVRENTYTEAQAANSVKIAELLQRLNHPTIAAIAGVQGQQDHLILLTGASTATTVPRTSLIQGIEANATVETPAGLVTYESEAAGFIVLVSNAGDQRAALYFKRTATAGDWSAPAFLTGAQGIQGNVGPRGITWKGAWNNIDAYGLNDVVRVNKSTWIALRANTNVSPPALPVTANDDWELFAPAGMDGTGTGDMIGPNGGVAINDLVVFGDATGKTAKKAPANIIGNSLLAQVATRTLKGRLSAGNGNSEDLTPAEGRQVLGGWEPIGDPLNVAGVISVDWNNLSPFILLKMQGCAQANASSASPGFYMVVSEDNGATFIVGGSTYACSRVGAEGDGLGAAGLVSMGFFPVTFDPLSANSLVGFNYTWSNWNKAGRHATVSGEADFTKSNNIRRWEKNFGYRSDNANARNALRFGSRDNFAFASGRVQLFGIRG